MNESSEKLEENSSSMSENTKGIVEYCNQVGSYGFISLAVALGDRLGIFDALNDTSPENAKTASDIAKTTKQKERYGLKTAPRYINNGLISSSFFHEFVFASFNFYATRFSLGN